MYGTKVLALVDTGIQKSVMLNFAKEKFTPIQIVLLLWGLNFALNKFQVLSIHYLVSFLSTLITYYISERYRRQNKAGALHRRSTEWCVEGGHQTHSYKMLGSGPR